MPRVADEPIGLKPFKSLGLEIEHQGGTQAIGDCPLCGKENKFYVNVETGQWDCKSCGEAGNVYTFFHQFWQKSMEETTLASYNQLSHHRLVRPESMKVWGVCKSITTGEWLIPGYNPEGKMTQLYRYVKLGSSGKYRCLLTPGPGPFPGTTIGHALFGANLLTSDAKTIYVCEGAFDGMALYEALSSYKDTGKKFVATATKSSTLIQDCAVIAVPSANVFNEAWAKAFDGLTVRFSYDSDKPRSHTKHEQVLPQTPIDSLNSEFVNGEANSNGAHHESGSNGEATHPVPAKFKPGPGLAGTIRAVGIIAGCGVKPKRIEYLRWGPDGYDPSRSDGWDIRDHLNADSKKRGELLADVLNRYVQVPAEWYEEEEAEGGEKALKPEKCESWKKLLGAWRKAGKITTGIERAIAVCLASIVSTEQPTDHLWVKIVGPPSSFKTTICEALAVSKKYVKSVSKIKGLHSGYKTDAEGAEDHSLIHQIRGKTLAIKDGDTLLQAGNLGEILSELRDAYDGVSRAEYRNSVKREYTNLKFTVLLYGTSSLRQLDASELGDRFLNVFVMDKIDPILEQEVNFRTVNRLRRLMGVRKGQEDKTDTAMQKARALTGGYVEYLRGKTQDKKLIADLLMDKVEMSDEAGELCMLFGTFVAYMRARPSTKQDEDAQREFSPRLVAQLGKLAFCLAVVLNKEETDNEVMAHVAKVAMDTAKGKTMAIIRALNRYGEKGMTLKALATDVNEPEDKLKLYLRFLRKIDAVQLYDGVEHFGYGCSPRYRVTRTLAKVYNDVLRQMKKLTNANGKS